MKRTIFLILAMLLIAAGSAAPLTAKDHKPDKDEKEERKITAEACKKNGWKTLTTEDRADDEDPQAFKNQGQCMKYVKDGGDLIRIDPEGTLALTSSDDDEDASDEDDTANDDDNGGVVLTVTSDASQTTSKDQPSETSLVIVGGTEPWNGYLQGTGFTPGEELTSVTFASERETLTLNSPVGTVVGDDGSFKTETIIYWCSEYHGYDEASGIVTVEDSAGKSYSQTFDMATHCEPAA